ncbi:hypothetical protein SEA_PETRUCHIO_90 [Mycobacterium phage Petruchio]|nr:hypothetical protein SEA_PETRUCHIO_90 [Mycobacterium phage Petruchio]
MRAYRGVPAAAQPTQRAHPASAHAQPCLPAARGTRLPCPRTPHPAYPLPRHVHTLRTHTPPSPLCPRPPATPQHPLPVRRPCAPMRQCLGTEDAYGLDAASTGGCDATSGSTEAPHRGDG